MATPANIRTPAHSPRRAAPLVFLLLLAVVLLASAPRTEAVVLAQTGSPIDAKIDFTCQNGQDSVCVGTRGRSAAGYLRDVGLAYGDQGNGWSYGWVMPGTTTP